jgi:microcystin-dependent protein
MDRINLGEIRIFAGNFAPQGWAICDGRVLSVADNQELYALIGGSYGGNGRTTFALPDLRSRVPIHFGTGPGLSPRALGSMGGDETVTLTQEELPPHTHTPRANNDGGSSDRPVGDFWPRSTTSTQFGDPSTANTTLNAEAVAKSGKKQAHDNMLPYLPLNFIIALQGVYPKS